ncbi:MAG: hypothetical protein ACI8XM_001232, partial [Haloarculaceae archaeon]
AVEFPIVYSNSGPGLYQPNGVLYVLEEHLDSVRAMREIVEDAGPENFFEAVQEADPDDYDGDVTLDTRLIEPLTIRANVGQTVRIDFHNHLNRNASMHNMGLPQDPDDSDGMNVGHNDDTTVAPGSSTTYTWYADHRGSNMFYDGANQAMASADVEPGVGNLHTRGLFGSIIVEPEGAYWTDPVTGEPLRNGTKADIHDPNFLGTSYREFVPYYHTPEGVEIAANDEELTWSTSDFPQTIHAMNYRAEPTGIRASDDESPDPKDIKTLFYTAWTNGDNGGGDNIFRTYKSDPVKFVAVGASTEENHIHHVHNHRWKEVPRKTESSTIDSQTLGFGTSYTEYLIAAHGEAKATPTQANEQTIRPELDWDTAFRRGGAGYWHGGTGDVIFHCHLFPHYLEGMWSHMRIFDKERLDLMPLRPADPEIAHSGTTIATDPPEPGSDELPLNDAILPRNSPVPGFLEPSTEADLKPNNFRTDFESFIPGVQGEFPPYPPQTATADTPVTGRNQRGAPKPQEYPDPTANAPTETLDVPDITDAEKAAGLEPDRPGAPYQDPIDNVDPDNIEGERTHKIHCVHASDIPGGESKVKEFLGVEHNHFHPLVYNDKGDYDDGALVYVHEENFDAVMNGEMNPEPLFFRAAVGEVIKVNIENHSEFPLSIHPHFVAFDPLATDNTPAIGRSYMQCVLPGETQQLRWFADEEGPIYFHDHTIGEAQHGTFAGLIVEPKGSEFLDPYSGDPIETGSQAIIDPGEGEPFREFALHYSDYTPLKDRDTGEYIVNNKEHNHNTGVTSINNRNEPYHYRDDEDPAYVHSSKVHGDPATPTLEAYSNDPIRIRLFQGSWEDQHNFTLHGRPVQTQTLNPQDTVTQIISPGEAFTMFVDPENTSEKPSFDRQLNPDDLPVRDYMYGSDIVDDRFTGMWGIHRVFDAEVPHLEPLPGRGTPTGEITADDLAQMGHPAPFLAERQGDAGVDALRSLGQNAYLLWSGDDDDRTLPPDYQARKNGNVGELPPKATDPGTPCGDVEPDRSLTVEALTTEIEFNDYGDHDPHGIVFALQEHAQGIRNGRRDAEPLTIRAKEDECIEVTLRNTLPAGGIDDDHPDPPMRYPDLDYQSSDRVSLHPQRITYDVNGSDGATVGFNYDQTVGPGESITYRWYADELYDNIVLTGLGDLRGHRHHGAFGNLIIEPEDATWLDPATAEPMPDGTRALIKHDGGNTPDQREFNLNISDGRFILNREDPDFCVVEGYDHSGEVPCTQLPENEPEKGYEDSGFGSINYSSEPFAHRFQNDSAQHKVYDSGTHGDPNTPLLRAQLDDEVKFLVAQTADKARGIAFHLSGHQWERYLGVDETPVIGCDDRFSPTKGLKLGMSSTAGGERGFEGDYIYQETKQRRRLESGMWGIFRVREDFDDFDGPVQPLPQQVDERLPPEDRPGWRVTRADVDGDGDEDLIVGVPASDVGAENGGAIYVFTDPEGPITDLAGADALLIGTNRGEGAGTDIEVEERGNGANQGNGQGANQVLVVETAAGPTYEIPVGKVFRGELNNPSDTSAREFMRNTTENEFEVVHEIEESEDGFEDDEEENFVEEETEEEEEEETEEQMQTLEVDDLALDGETAGAAIECQDCGQHSMLAGEESRWEKVSDMVDRAASVFQCEDCGSQTTVKY